MTMKRRDALKTIGGLAGAAGLAKFLPGCGGGDDGPVGITTYVYLMLENRTYDHYLGARALDGLGGDGLTAGMANPDRNGVLVAPFTAPEDRGLLEPLLCDIDPPHGWEDSRAQLNGGACDGFLRVHQESTDTDGQEPMRYMTRAHIPITWALADAYASCDRWFSSLLGPTMPNRAYWFAGTSVATKSNDELIQKFTSLPVPTIFNRLTEKGIDWAYYFGNTPVVSVAHGNESPYKLDLGPGDGTGRVRRFGEASLGFGTFFEDAAAGRLPQVCYIDPAFYENDDHPPIHPIKGQELIASVYTALAKSPQWKNCLLVVTYDEHGGYYDHVAPPTAPDDTFERFGGEGFDQLGFRVPTLVVGPYVKPNYVSSVQYDHTSALKQLQNTFGLDPLTRRVDAAADLSDCLDLERLARGEPLPPIELPILDVAEWPTLDESCTLSGSQARVDDLTAFARANPHLFGGWDLSRERAVDSLLGIHRYLAANAGTILKR